MRMGAGQCTCLRLFTDSVEVVSSRGMLIVLYGKMKIIKAEKKIGKYRLKMPSIENHELDIDYTLVNLIPL